MKFRIWTMLWVFALLASAMATFGVYGGPCALFVVSCWGFLFFRKRRLVGGLFLTAIGLLAGTMFVIWLEPVRSPWPRNTCMNNLRQIALAIQNYEKCFGELPPAFSKDDEGEPLHSWRVLLLPFLEHYNLYKAINLNEPWDSPANRKFWDMMPDVYRCASRQLSCRTGVLQQKGHFASYFAIVGPNTAWPQDKNINLNEIRDDSSTTLLIAEAYMPDVCWMEPRDLSVEETSRLLTSSDTIGHLSLRDSLLTTSLSSKGTTVALADGYAKGITRTLHKSDLLSLVTRSGGEPLQKSNVFIGTDHFDTLRLAVVYKWKRIYAFVLFSLLSVLPLTRLRQRKSVADHSTV